REGSGRPLGSPNKRPRKDIDGVSLRVLKSIDCIAVWQRLLSCNSPKVVLGAMQYLTDRVYGRPAQTIQGGSQPVKIEFSYGGVPTPACMPPTAKVESRLLEASPPNAASGELWQQVVGQIEDENQENEE